MLVYLHARSVCNVCVYIIAQATAGGTVDMSSYYAGSGGGCFGPQSTVRVVTPAFSAHTETRAHSLTASPTTAMTAISAVKAGDVVKTATGVATVTCVVKIARGILFLIITILIFWVLILGEDCSR